MKDLRLFCYGEQTYGSGSKGSEQFYNIEIIKGQQQKHGLVLISYLQVNQAPLFSFSAAVHEVFTMEGLYTSVHTTLFYYGTESITEKKNY